jgi:D-serine ammonia-lyase
MAANIPLPSKASLVQQYVGKSLKDIPLPAAVLDIAAVKRNCQRMLETVNELGWALRPAVSNHKVGGMMLTFRRYLNSV